MHILELNEYLDEIGIKTSQLPVVIDANTVTDFLGLVGYQTYESLLGFSEEFCPFVRKYLRVMISPKGQKLVTSKFVSVLD